MVILSFSIWNQANPQRFIGKYEPSHILEKINVNKLGIPIICLSSCIWMGLIWRAFGKVKGINYQYYENK